MKTGKRFNLDIQTEEENKDNSKSPKRAGPPPERKTPKDKKSPLKSPTGSRSPGGTSKRSPLNRKSPLASIKAGFARGINATSGLPSISNYGYNKRNTINGALKSPKDPREMWKKPEIEGSDSDGADIVTRVVQQADFEVFETDAPDVDFDELNENEMVSIDPKKEHPNCPNINDLVIGLDIVVEDVSTSQAYQVFSQIEEAGLAQNELEITSELASQKLERLTKELDQIQQELKSLEADELPSALQKDSYSAKEQLRLVDELKQMMNRIQIETAETKTGKLNDLELNSCLNKILTDKRILTQQSINLELSDNIEIYLRAQSYENQKELKKDQHVNFLKVQSIVDQTEKLIGQRDNQIQVYHKFTDVYSMTNQLQKQIFIFKNEISNNEEGFNKSTKELNDALIELSKQLEQIKDIDYDKTKIDFLYSMTEHSIEQNGYLYVLLERLKLIDQMHQQSPGIQMQIQKIQINSTTQIPTLSIKENEELILTRDTISKAVCDIKSLI